MFNKVLVANRGEIACRVIRTLRDMGIRSVAVYSDVDRAALHVRMADEAVSVGEAPASSSYLRVDRILEAVQKTRAQAVHPGYGFLSENAAFAQACEDNGIVFIGPPASAIAAMGSKTAARELMEKAGVPVVPGARCATVQEATEHAQQLGYPVMLKAAAGGGGKGMRLVASEDEMANAWERAKSESKKAFGDDTVYLEKAIVKPRHVEIQVLGDRFGNVVHLFERDCSIQRRHQKVVEETPCPVLTQDIVEKMGKVAVQGAKAVNYFSAGTFEFLLSADQSFYFLEMNTRLQVEHPITEWVTGTDLVREMIRVAAGEPLSWNQEQIQRHGASIECRVYAEDPANDFLPSPGTIEQLRAPAGPGVRDDSGAYPGCTISSDYDPLISKLAVWAPTREQAIARMRRALHEYVITGIRTNLAFHERLMNHPGFIQGVYDTGFIDAHRDQLMGFDVPHEEMTEPLAVAVAMAAVGLERKMAATAHADCLDASRLSAWVATHRARRST
ncbi:MAG TPA: acetyl-CoA carboxylase biotin carboxylase subunit [Polyangiaceae bacterium]|jgi:acetyl-CoA carboxylase biotin carboxylase subunit|nr:MAG: Acetyl-/propionyl-coenzyme A carboxylase alpha chain [Deltaproteobacteria bacterium ADurb.Bin207]HNZ20750.1 acetyl-CoA carboxylase biotin carboxylase subunit [Polyangiaceae bacterium]HOD23826.1 acetyl-CoA carboxylase biotin carboxylase subunit [Polyangiaceae bacterium]HOE49167.1 acetyl-CoA carboxylase biotin carboxylase subunit [Polyangiaceae bacterium]HOG99280.1 acetyl-CoA carboxylase biotin carboxylase subunit [Polyangiaceae bacterium]